VSDPIVGIDLGTSNSVVAHTDEAGTTTVLSDDSGYKIHPSVVSFHPNGGVVVGAGAKQRKVIDPHNTIYSVKRLIGRSFKSPEVQTARTRVPYAIKEGSNQLPLISTRGGEFAVPEISAIVLDHMRNIAVARLGTPVTRAVVTVPASFNDAQRSATATAGAIAGLTVVRVLNEPTAAALAYGHTRNLRQTIAVYDFGGGTFDITILKLADQVYEVLGTSGDTFLGGDDLDERLVDKMVGKFLAENRIDLRTNEVAMMRLRAVAEQTKIELSRRARAVVRIDEIAYGAKGAPLNLQIEISREEFVGNVADIIDRTFPVCQEALGIAGLSVTDIHDVILVGGTTKIPYVRDQVSKFFARPPRTDVNPEDAVAIGAALQAQALERILSKPKRSEPARAPAGEETTGGGEPLTDVVDFVTGEAPHEQSGSVTMAPADDLVTGAPRVKRAETTDYTDPEPRGGGEPRPDTSYSMTRAGARDHFDEKTSETTEGRTNPMASPMDLPIGRLSKSMPAVPPPPPSNSPARTVFGVAPPPVMPPSDAVPPPMPKMGTSRIPVPQRPPADMTNTPLTLPALPRGAVSPSTPPPPRPPMPPFRPPAPPTRPPVANPAASTLVALAPDFEQDIDTSNATSADAFARGLGGAPSATPGLDTLLQSPTAAPLFDLPDPASAPAPLTWEQSRPAGPLPYVEPQRAQAPTLMAIPQASTHATMPAPVMRPPVVLEVTPRGLGIATVAGFCEELIRRNSRVPAEIRRVFTTSRDQQDLVRIVICQGESRRLDNNTIIGDLVLQNLQPRPRGETAIEVTFTLDASGILQVSARDALTGAEQRASLDLVGGVPQQDVAASRDRLQQLRR
jgi:molecular chaperone DnaK